MRRLILVGVTATALAIATGTAAPLARVAQTAAPPNRVFVGRVAGTPAFVAFAVGHSRVRAYLCDSRQAAAWFLGPIRNGRIDLCAGGLRLQASLDATASRGTVTLADGQTHTFVARPALRQETAGLYRGAKTVSGIRYIAGWILLPGGAQRGSLSVFHPGTVTFYIVKPAPRLNPEAASVQLAGAGQVSVTKLDSFDFPANVG